MKKVCLFFMLLFISLFYFPIKTMAKTDDLLLINLKTNQLSFFEDGNYVRTFPIAVGKPATPTPEGTFCVINKYKNKEYHRKKIKGGAPNNPLGTRWLGLNEKEYAIHGTNNDSSIGRKASTGCIRMHNRHVEWLYDHVPIGAKVIIAQFYSSPEYTAHQYGYRVVSWNGKAIRKEQIGRITLLDQMKLYWQEPNGQFTEVKKVLPNEVYPVYSTRKEGVYYIGNNLYVFDETGEKIRYEQVPRFVLTNLYKRKYSVE
ncbi:L,D-transpeptidase [Bacillus manliponensis]|uniref:L,D-transpeptidase n=1 Tax=Bacillus manliponensis TaxID=574376 RepID=UPI0035161075